MRFAKVYVEITNVCNLNCSFCPQTRRMPGCLSVENFRRILTRLCGWTEYLYFHLMGEPLLHPELGRLLQIAGEMGFRVILTTNTTLLSRAEQTLLAAPALHKVNLSLQAFEANEKLDPAACLQTCIRFAQHAAERGVLVNFRLWNLDGAGTVGRNLQNDSLLSLLHEAFPQPWQSSRGGEKLSQNVYLSWGETFRWPELTESEVNAAHGCYGLRDQLGVLWDGTVVPCCLDHEGDIALGNLLQDYMEEILSRPRTRAILEGFRRGEAVEELCRRCGYANRFSVK